MNDMILDTNNYCSPIYTVDQSSPHYEAVWKLFGHLGWSKEQRRANFIQGRFNAFSSILHKLNQKSAYVFSTDLSKMSHTVRGWPISYDCLTQTIKRLEELEWLVRHKPEVENQDFLFDLAGVEKPTKRARGKADRFVAPEGSPLRLGYELTVVPILDKQGRHHIGPSICLYARGAMSSCEHLAAATRGWAAFDWAEHCLKQERRIGEGDVCARYIWRQWQIG